MKKTVIKRRKRVPAAIGAGGGSSSSATTSPSHKPGHVRGESTGVRMSDQAAAEALVAVGRLGRRGDDGEESDDEEGEEADEFDGEQPPRKKRAAASARRGNASVGVSLRKTRSHSSVAAGEERRSASAGGRELRKRSSAAAVAAAGASAGWVTDGGERSESPQQQMGVMRRHHNHHPHIHPALQGEYGQPPRSAGAGVGQFPPGSFDLPPFNGANGMMGMMGLGMGFGGIGGMGLGALGTVAGHHASSYIRSGAPSRSGSPSSGLDMMGYIVGGGGGGAVPSVADLERHYAELAEQKRRMEEMVERTERLMSGVRKGIEEIRASGGSRAASPRPGTGQGVTTGSPRLPGQVMGLGHTHVGITSTPRVPSPLGSPRNQVKSQDQQQQHQESLKIDGLVSAVQHRLEGGEDQQQHDDHHELEQPSMPLEVPLERVERRTSGGGGSVWPVAPAMAE